MERLIFALCYIIFAPLLGGLLEGIDRKISARMQGRKGPSIFQSIWDVQKLWDKQVLTVSRSQVFLIFTYFIFIVLTGVLFFAGFDMLMCFFSLTTATMFLVLASTVTYSPYSTLGAERELIQMMSYEPMVLLTAVGFYLATGSFETSKIIEGNISPIAKIPGIFVGFLFILTIKMRKSPFDLSTSHHAHQEMVKGISTEMSGKLLAAYTVAEWYENIFLLGIIALFIINTSVASIPIAILVCAAAYFFEILVDNVNARMNWKHTLIMTWIVTFLFAVTNIFILDIIK